MFKKGDLVRRDGLIFVVHSVNKPYMRITSKGNPGVPDGIAVTVLVRECQIIKPSKRNNLSTWETQAGDIIDICKLETPHLLNIVAMLHRKGSEKNPQRSKLVTLEKEAIRRLQESHNV